MLALHRIHPALCMCTVILYTGGCGPHPGETTGGGETTTDTGTPNSTGATAPTTGGDAFGPHEGEFEVVVDALPFPLSGPGKITRLTVGRKEYGENFANRGRVEVLFDHPEETITIEIRPYTFGEPSALEYLHLYAFVDAGDPTHTPDPADDCTRDTWKDNCAIYAHFDGKSQPYRSGLDLRVHLPTGYRGFLRAETEDNTEEPSYPRRGDIHIDNLCGSGEVLLEAGRAQVRLCPELTPGPTCLPDEIQACETYPDGSGSEAWSLDCPCSGDRYGQLTIRAPQPWAADITVDVPTGVWMTAALRNDAPAQPHECRPQAPACEPGDCQLDDSDEYDIQAEFNHPSPAAPIGGGYTITAQSGGCTLVPAVESPGDWSPEQEPPAELRGFVTLCSGCL